MTEGIYRHPPGRLSRWGVVDVGLKCVHSCRFCYYSHLGGEDDQFIGMRKAPLRPTSDLLALAAGLNRNGFLGFDVTGGEPCLHPGIVELARAARALGLAMRVITLGQYLTRGMMKAAPGRPLIDALVDDGVADFLLSVHAVDDDNFRTITGESWPRLLAAMARLDERGFDYGTNTTVFAGNYRLLPEIAAEIARHRVYVANFIVMNAYYAWGRPGAAETGAVQGHYGEIRPYLVEARDLLEGAGVAVNVRYAPLCTMRGLERNLVGVVGVRHDPHEWMSAIDHMDAAARPEAMARRLPLNDFATQYPLEARWDAVPRGGREYPTIAERPAGKVFPMKCQSCRAMPVCDGLDANYLGRVGDGELEPYAGFRGDLLDRERLAYLPAFLIKTAPFADARGAVAALMV